MSFTIGLIAVNCAALQLAFGSGGNAPGLLFGVLGILPMANVLAIGLYRIAYHRPSRRPFLVGFELSGLAAIAAWLDLALAIDQRRLIANLDWIYESFENSEFGFNLDVYLNDRDLWVICFLVGFLAVYTSTATLAQLLVGLLGGLVARGWSKGGPSPALSGVICGQVIELDRGTGLPDGQEVVVTVVPVARSTSPLVSSNDEVRRRIEEAGEQAV
jgi:hypothetical protein